MIYRRCVERILGSRTKIGILRTLHKFPEKEFSSRELAKFIGASHTGVLKAIRDLEEMNIALVRTHGKAHTIKLNRRSVLSGMLKIFEMDDKILGMLTDELAVQFKDAVSVVLFGSIVSGREEPHSDIDVMIVTENKEGAEKDVALIQKRVAERFGNSISPYIINTTEFNRMKNTALMKSIIKNNILIKGKELGAIR